MNTMTIEEFHAALNAQGVPLIHCAFRCPMCKTVQSAFDLLEVGAAKSMDEVEKYLAFSCIGRFTNAGPHRKWSPSGKGCDWTLGGLFKIHTFEVVTEDGERHPRFELATPEEAQAHYKKAREVMA